MVMDIFGMIFSAENMRMLILLVFGYAAVTRLRMSLETRINDVEKSLTKLIDEKIEAFHIKIKQNDFAHLNSTIEALTFALEKNKFLLAEDKTYIDSRLDR